MSEQPLDESNINSGLILLRFCYAIRWHRQNQRPALSRSVRILLIVQSWAGQNRTGMDGRSRITNALLYQLS